MMRERKPIMIRVIRATAAVLGTVMLIAANPLCAELDELECSALFKEGSDLFQQANEVSGSDAVRAGDLYRGAAMRFERIVREGGVENGKLFYNIGNAYFRAGDTGRAILNYRRAEQFEPNDTNLQQNLQFARSRRKDAFGETERAKVLQTLLFWHYDFSFGQRFALFAVAFVVLWGAAATRLFVKRPFLRWVIGIAGIVSLATGASLVAESVVIGNVRPGVVVAGEVVARKGDSETYEASFQDPLHAGTEFVLVEERGDWLHVELPDGRRCWLPANAAGLVR